MKWVKCTLKCAKCIQMCKALNENAKNENTWLNLFIKINIEEMHGNIDTNYIYIYSIL